VLKLDCKVEGKVSLLTLVSTNSLHLPALDELFAYNGPFGEEAASLYLWSPTAQVHFLLILIFYAFFNRICIIRFYTIVYI